MTNEKYVEGVLSRESRDISAIAKRLLANEGQNIRLLHAAMGLATEAGEFVDALKKHLFYGKPLDIANLREELGDLFWYCGVAASALNTSFDEVMQINQDKLFKRYKDGFTEAEAKTRDLIAERKILEKTGIAGNKCESGNECGCIGCPNCQK